MLNRRNYALLAALTAALFVVAAAIGPDRDLIGNLDQVVFFAFLGCVVVLVAMTVGLLVKAVSGRRSTG